MEAVMKSGRKNIHIEFLFAFCLLILPLGLNAQFGGRNDAVRVYEGRNSSGNSESFGVGTYRSNQNEFGSLRNDQASSVNVSRGFSVRLCENEGNNGDGEGKCEEYGEGSHNLRYEKSVSYIRVWRSSGNGNGNGGGFGGGNLRSALTVFEDRDFRGRSQTFGPGVYLNAAGQLGNLRNDKASSIIVGRGYRVRLCEDEGTDGRGSGRCEEYREGSVNLRYDNTASFVQVRRANGGGNGWWDEEGVILYSNRGQSGNQQSFNVGTYRNDQGQLNQIGNDSASSVFVSPGYRVRVCENEGGGNGSGKCEEFGAGSYNLRYERKASYLRVWRSR